MVTIKDVAKASGFDISTVSRALRFKGYVKRDTYAKIKEIAESLGYIADSSAQQLRNGKSKTIGIIVSDINNPFYIQLIAHIEQKFKEHGSMILIGYSLENPEEEKNCFYTLMAAKVSTIIFTPVTDTNSDIIKRTLLLGIKIIQLYRQVYNFIPAMIFDDEYGAYLSTKQLIENNCKHIMLIDVSYNHITCEVSPSRAKGYLAALKEFNYDYSLILPHDLVKKTPAYLNKFIEKNKPDAIIAGTNNFAMEALTIIKGLGLSVPKDIKFISFDDLDWFSYLSISAINQPIKQLADCIIEEIGKTEITSSLIKIKPSLSIRASSLNEDLH